MQFALCLKSVKRTPVLQCLNCKKLFVNIILTLCVLALVKKGFDSNQITVNSIIDFKPLDPENNRQQITEASSNLKTILLWTRYYSSSIFRYQHGSTEPFKKFQCKVQNCIVTEDRSLFNQSDAVIFSAGDMNLTDLPSHRFPNQRFVFYLLETLPGSRNHAHFFKSQTDSFFNWTMSFRRHSDIFESEPHGILRRKKSSVCLETLPERLYPGVELPSSFALMDVTKREERKKIANKTKLVAWFSSNCNSNGKREVYINELKKHIDVDIYGKCGDKVCLPRNSMKCNNLLDEYKFYLSFENSICPDYITEKFYRALQRDIVPIVYGGGDYANYAPPHSYIHVSDFPSPKELADYLKFLDKNDAMYLKYFEWKKDYEVGTQPMDGWCELCEKLNQNLPEKTYEKLTKWWYDDVPCYSGDDFIKSLKLN